MKRRAFITGLVGAVAPALRVAHAQQAVRRVGVFFGANTESDPDAKLIASILQDGLQKLGWTVGRDVRFEYRYSGGDPAAMARHVAELVALAPDVIAVRGNRPAALIKHATRTIPIVFAQVGDPVGAGLIDNLARPGGNVTGFTHFETSMGGKWLEVLKDVAPSVGRVAILMHPETPANVEFLRVAQAAAPALGVTLTPAAVRDAASIEQAIAEAAGPGSGFAVMPHDVTVAHNRLIVALAAQHRLPAAYPYRFFVTQGGLVSYSFDFADHWQRVTGLR